MVKRTRQREVILSVLENSDRPLTRDEILHDGRIQMPRLGSATVDRALRELAEEFLLVGVQFPGQPRRFELPAEEEHPHFICRGCDKVYDLPVKMKLPEIELPPGFSLAGGEVIYSGLCPSCS